MQNQLIPLFPLNLVLFPSATLPLYIFEERYKEMVAQCLEDDIPFGVLYVDRGKIASIGTTARITEVVKKWDDGRMHIITKGEERFEVQEFIRTKEYLQGHVESVVDDEDSSLNDQELNALKKLFRDYRNLRKQNDTETGDGEADEKSAEDEAEVTPPNATFQVLAEVSMESGQKQKYLEIQSESERAQLLIKQMKETVVAISRFYRLRAMLGGNGFLPPEGPEWEYFKDVDYL